MVLKLSSGLGQGCQGPIVDMLHKAGLRIEDAVVLPIQPQEVLIGNPLAGHNHVDA